MILTDDELNQDLKILLEEGIDEKWWASNPGNFMILNMIRATIGLPEITLEKWKATFVSYLK